MRRKPFVVVLSVLALSSVACSTVDAEGYVWEEYERNREEILRLSALLAEKHEDTAEARSRWDATRERLNVARARERRLLCRDRPEIASPEELFESLGLPLSRRLIDRARLDAFVDAKEADGTLSGARAAQLRILVARSGDEIMNPSSLGASQINQRIAQALRCYGLDSEPGDPNRVEDASKTPAPPLEPPDELHWFTTCGDPVCRDSGYRGPFPGVPLCSRQKPGDACLDEGERCDLVDNCNMLLICAREDPATRCAR